MCEFCRCTEQTKTTEEKIEKILEKFNSHNLPSVNDRKKKAQEIKQLWEQVNV
jgi:hypothetical protein